MKEDYLTNENISNNIMLPNADYSLKERRIPNNNNNVIIYSLSSKEKPESKGYKVNDLQSSIGLKQEPTIAEEDIDYLELFSQKNKNNYNNPNNRIRKSKFFYSNRMNNYQNPKQNKNQIQRQFKRAISSNFNQVPQKNNFNYSKNSNIYLNRRGSGKEEHQNFKQNRFNSATERGFGYGRKMTDINPKVVIENKEQITSGNINTNMNTNLNRKKIPLPQKNGYNIHPKVNKDIKIKLENSNDYNREKNKIRNKNIFYEKNNYNVYKTPQGLDGNSNTSFNMNHQIPLQNSMSEMANLENIFIEDKENIIPNHNNSFNYNTINNSNGRNSKIPINMKLYGNNSKNLSNTRYITNYNSKTKVVPLAKLNEKYIYNLQPNPQIKITHSMNKSENKNFYEINDYFNTNNKEEGNNYYKESYDIIQPKKQKNLREFIIKKIPQNDNNSKIINEMKSINNTEGKEIRYNYEEKENYYKNNYSANTQISNYQNNKDEYKSLNEINNSYIPKESINIQKIDDYLLNDSKKQINLDFQNYKDNQLINNLVSENLNPNLYVSVDSNIINTNKKYNKHSQNSVMTKIPIPQKPKINNENKKSDFTIINNSQVEENNNIIMQKKLKNTSNSHFPDPEKPVRKESFSITNSNSNQNSSNVTYNIFNASGWLKNYAILTNPGVDKTGNQKTNQDSFVFKTNINGINNFNIFGVMDGHGPQGHFVSQFSSKFIPFQITNHREIKALKDPEEIYQKLKYNEYEIINQIFIETDKQLQKVNFDATESGSTCVLVIHIGSHIICANTGDSRAIIISDSLGENNIDDFFEVALSYDYKPEMPEEKQRIESCGGVVEQLKNKMGEGVGPYRVWVKEGGYPGLAMSRSIGDLIGKKLGVIPNPGILEYDLNKNVKYIVVASDGIWEFLSNENVRDIGKKYYMDNNPNGFCHEIVKYSYKLWKENGICVDDITAITAFF